MDNEKRWYTTMRILMINYEFPPLGGGGGVACYQLSREVARTHHVDYITSGFKGLPKLEDVDSIGVHRVWAPGRKDLSTATLLSMALFFPSSLLAGIKLCRKNRYDVISVHFVIPSGPSGVLLSRMFHIPVTTSVYGGDVYDPSKNTSPHRFFFTRKLISWLLNSSDAIIAESGNIKELTEKYYQPKAKVEVIPVGFMVPAFAPVSREELGLRPDDFLIISIGRLVKRKGFDVAIQALAALPDQKMKYLIIGDGPEEQVLKALAKDLGVQDRVLFLGFQPEDKKYQYLAVADIYLLSSLHEGFGICLMEAMYSGLPIVSTDNGGQTDLLDDGRNALLAPAGDPGALAAKIKALVADYDARLRMRADNKKDIDKYSIKNVAGEYLSVLSGVR